MDSILFQQMLDAIDSWIIHYRSILLIKMLCADVRSHFQWRSGHITSGQHTNRKEKKVEMQFIVSIVTANRQSIIIASTHRNDLYFATRVLVLLLILKLIFRATFLLRNSNRNRSWDAIRINLQYMDLKNKFDI